MSQFKINTCLQPFWPESIYPNQGSCDVSDPTNVDKWFYRINGSRTDVCVAPFSLNHDNDDETTQPEPEPLTSNDINSALGNFGEWYSPLNFEMPLDLYRKLNENPDLLTQNSSIDSFYYANQYSNIYKFYRVDSAIRFVFQLASGERHILKAYRNESDSLKNMISLNDSLLSTVTSLQDSMQLASLKQSMVTALIEVYDQIDSLISEIASTREAMVSLIESWNDSIVPNGIVENNKRISNLILLQTVYHGINHLTENQMNLISPIAWQCVLIGGRGLLTARSLYELSEDQQFNDEVLCNPGQSFLETKNSLNRSQQFSIQPNPNKGSFFLLLQSEILKKDLSLEVFNMEGKKLYQQMISFEKQNYVEINPSPNLKAGLYFINIFDKVNLLFTTKMIIE